MDYFDILLAKKLNGGGGGDITIENLTITANGEYRAPSGKAYGKVTANVPAPSNALFKQTLSNLPSPIATFTGADAPLDSLKASIVGQQDLHGYDHPWAGGAGKNKLNSTEEITVGGITFTSVSDYYITVSPNNTDPRTWSYDKCQWFLTLPAGDYKISWEVKTPPTSSSAGIAVYDSENNRIANLSTATVFASNGYIDFTLTEEKSLGVLTKLYDGSVRFMVCSATAPNPTTFAPYSNICPISGWTGCEVTDNNDTYTIPFKDSSDNPITVYDGGIDITGGRWLSNRLFEVFDNTATVTFGRDGQPNWYYQIAGTNTGTSGETAETISNIYSYANIGNDNDNLGIMKLTNGNLRVRVGGTQPATVDDFVNSLGVTPLQVVSKLATPIVMQFDPIAIRSDGVTNISVDCGEVTECKYYSDTP